MVPFNDLTALDSRIYDAMQAEKARTQTWGRLSQLKKAVSGAIDNGVANQVAYERAAVARGDIAPADTMESQFAASARQFLEERAAGNGAIARAGNDSAGRQALFPGSRGTQSEGRGQSGASSGNPGIPGDVPPAPNFDQAAAQRLAAAKQKHIEYQNLRKGPVGGIVRGVDGPGSPSMAASSIPGAVFAKGPAGYEKGMAWRAGVKNDPSAVAQVHDYAAMTLRQTADKQNTGVLDPSGFLAWKSAYEPALRAFPEIAPKFATVAKASEALKKFEPFRADMAPSGVPEVFFHSGPSGGEGVANLRRLVGNDKAASVLSDYAAAKLKATASNPDGTLNPAKVATFQKTHAEALKALPGLVDKFSTAAKAQDTVDAVARARKTALDNWQAGAIGKVMNAAPGDITKNIGSMFGASDSAAQFQRLAREASTDRTGAATTGLRKGIADFINSNFISNTEAGTSGSNLVKADAFQTFMRKNRAALATVFKPEELASMDAIAADLHRANRSVTAVKLPGQSNTAQDLTAVSKGAHAGPGSFLRDIAEGSVAGHIALGPVGAVAGGAAAVGKHIVSSMRAAGYAKIDDLVRDALLNPDLAKALMMKAPIRAGHGSEITLAQQLKRLSMFGAAQTAIPQP